MEQDLIEASFFQSALTLDNQFQSTEQFLDWFKGRKSANNYVVQQIPFGDMDKWDFSGNPHRLVHRSGKFFSIEGIRIKTNFGFVPEWDQPIIKQPEIGILGFITKVFNGVRYFLVQAKMEPGNINTIQISPTVQATKSNFTQAHKGKIPLYLEYFIDRSKSTILVDQLQSEQGSRFFHKQNRNMVVDVSGEILPHEDFSWLTLGEIKQLLGKDNLVNMDARAVISCIPFMGHEMKSHFTRDFHANNDEILIFDSLIRGFQKELFCSMQDSHAQNTLNEIISWVSEWKFKCELWVERISLDDMLNWELTENEIHHVAKRFLSVIAVCVEAGNREVVRWTQPILKHTGYGLIGFLTQKKNGILHFLVCARMSPGTVGAIEIGPTVACSGATNRAKTKDAPFFLDLFLSTPVEQIRYDTIQSEEGGRFYHFQNRYMIIELPPDSPLEFSDKFKWMTLGQILELVKHGYFNIEARNLLSCLHFAGNG